MTLLSPSRLTKKFIISTTPPADISSHSILLAMLPLSKKPVPNKPPNTSTQAGFISKSSS
eukprot:scaffold29752_cov303-Skeletonema_menzelii.AAC.2